ncbi:MAG: hypothetical protein NZO16_02180 [Deltaproteobacteria bacterium]|nr:hypothetical protein [Deltaproteobacteria bacterium]
MSDYQEIYKFCSEKLKHSRVAQETILPVAEAWRVGNTNREEPFDVVLL